MDIHTRFMANRMWCTAQPADLSYLGMIPSMDYWESPLDTLTNVAGQPLKVFVSEIVRLPPQNGPNPISDIDRPALRILTQGFRD